MRKGRSRPFHALALSLLLTLPLTLPGLAVSAPRTTLPEVVPAPFVYDRPLPLSLPHLTPSEPGVSRSYTLSFTLWTQKEKEPCCGD